MGLADGVGPTIHDPAFALLGTMLACDGQTDGHVAIAKTALCIAPHG